MGFKSIMILHPDKLLREKSLPVTEINSDILDLFDTMRREMESHKGIGISAVQVGSLLRCMIVKDLAIVNPHLLLSSSDTEIAEEACLSIPKVIGKVKRSSKLSIVYTTLENKQKFLEVEGYDARIVQHELDHLDGILFIDKMSRLRRCRLMKNYSFT